MLWSVKIYMAGLEQQYGRYVLWSAIGAEEAVQRYFPGLPIRHHTSPWRLGNGAGSLLVISKSGPIWGHLERMYARVRDMTQPGTRAAYTERESQV
jgi:hypothetical protein